MPAEENNFTLMTIFSMGMMLFSMNMMLFGTLRRKRTWTQKNCVLRAKFRYQIFGWYVCACVQRSFETFGSRAACISARIKPYCKNYKTKLQSFSGNKSICKRRLSDNLKGLSMKYSFISYQYHHCPGKRHRCLYKNSVAVSKSKYSCLNHSTCSQCRNF